MYSILYHYYYAYKKIVLCIDFSNIVSLLLPDVLISHS